MPIPCQQKRHPRKGIQLLAWFSPALNWILAELQKLASVLAAVYWISLNNGSINRADEVIIDIPGARHKKDSGFSAAWSYGWLMHNGR